MSKSNILELAKKLVAAIEKEDQKNKVMLKDIPVGGKFDTGIGRFIVLEQKENYTAVITEMSAEEALKTYTEFCSEHSCNDCPIQKLDTTYYCTDIRKEYPEDVVKVLKQWKADHEKKPIETKWVWYVKIIEADTHLLKHEELLELDFSIPMDQKKEEILKKYCAEHDGKYYVTDERRCVVKE